jgi:deoxycytidylate deaminase
VNSDKRIVGIGYNGFPRGCSDDELPWARHADDELDTKYPVGCKVPSHCGLRSSLCLRTTTTARTVCSTYATQRSMRFSIRTVQRSGAAR